MEYKLCKTNPLFPRKNLHKLLALMLGNRSERLFVYNMSASFKRFQEDKSICTMKFLVVLQFLNNTTISVDQILVINCAAAVAPDRRSIVEIYANNTNLMITRDNLPFYSHHEPSIIIHFPQ